MSSLIILKREDTAFPPLLQLGILTAAQVSGKYASMNNLLCGEGTYVANVATDNALYASFVRADQPGSVLQTIDDSALADDPHIELVLSRNNIAESIASLRSSIGAVEESGRAILARGDPLYLGEPIALVLATTPFTALDGAEKVMVEVADTGPLPDTTLVDWSLGDQAETRALIDAADHQITTTLRVPRISAVPMEPAAAIAEWRSDESRLHLCAPSQGVHRIRDEICEMLGVPPAGLRVRSGDVGGAFGGRIHALREHAALLLAAHLTGSPIVWVAERQESMVAEFHARDLVATVTAGFKKSGELIGVATDMETDCGESLSTNYTPIVTQYFAAGLCGAYAIPSVAVTAKATASARTPTAAFRGAGHPEGFYVIERVMDEAARALGLSAVEIRERNLISGGASTFSGLELDNIDPSLTLRLGAEHLVRLETQAKAQPVVDSLQHGFGISLYVKANGMGRREECALALSSDGKVGLKVGSQSNGQGHEQTFENLVARVMEVEAARVVLHPGDTDLLATGTGTGGSAALTTTGAALMAGAEKLREKVIEVAAEHLEVSRDDIHYQDGVCTVPGTDLAISLEQLSDDEILRERVVSNGIQEITFTTTVGCHAAWVSVDVQTGEVQLRGYASYDDVGNILEPALLDGQIHGGVAQGIGQAIGERMVYDTTSGQLLTASFMDYWIARADDLPFFEVHHGQTPAANPLGTRGVGEAGVIPASAVVANAVADALSPLGAGLLDLPLTPNRVWAALRG